MTYLGYTIATDEDFDGNKLFVVELRDGGFADFATLADAKAFVRALQPQNW